MEQEVPRTAFVQGLHPVHGARRRVDQGRARGTLAHNQGVDTDIIGADPQRVNRFFGVQTEATVVLLGEVQRELALEYRRERPERDVVRAGGSGPRKGEEVEVPVLRGVHGPSHSVVTSIDLCIPARVW